MTWNICLFALVGASAGEESCHDVQDAVSALQQTQRLQTRQMQAAANTATAHKNTATSHDVERSLVSKGLESTVSSKTKKKIDLDLIPCMGIKLAVKHGWISDGTCVTKEDFASGMKKFGLGDSLSGMLSARGLLPAIANQSGEIGTPADCLDFTQIQDMVGIEHSMSSGLIDPKPNKELFYESIASVAATGSVGNSEEGRKRKLSKTLKVNVQTLLAADSFLKERHATDVAAGRDVVGAKVQNWVFVWTSLLDAFGTDPEGASFPYSREIALGDFYNMVFNLRLPKKPVADSADIVMLNATFPDFSKTSPSSAFVMAMR